MKNKQILLFIALFTATGSQASWFSNWWGKDSFVTKAVWYFTAPKLENGIDGFADDSALIGKTHLSVDKKIAITFIEPVAIVKSSASDDSALISKKFEIGASMKSVLPKPSMVKTKKQVHHKDGVPYSFDSETESLVTPLDLLQKQKAQYKTRNQAIAIIAAGYSTSLEMNDDLIDKYEMLIAKNKRLESQVAQSLAREEQLKQMAQRAEGAIGPNLNESTLADFSLGNLTQDPSEIAEIRARYRSPGRSGVAAGSPGIDSSLESYDIKQRTRTFSDVSEIACDSMDQSSILGK